MNDLESKIAYQLKAILSGEASLLEQAHTHNINVERVEEKIREGLENKKIFGYDDVMDVIFAGYCIGRRDQALSIFAHLVGKDRLDELYKQVCTELGISPKNVKQLN